MFDKKAVTELTSFVFITLIVVVASSTAYLISTSYLESNIGKLDRDKMESNLQKMKMETERMISFDNTTVSFPIDFNTGLLVFDDNQIFYQSIVAFEDSGTYCFSGLCYQGSSGFERLYVNLSDSYTFQNNLSLDPGSYVIILKTKKDENQFQIRFR